MSSCATERTWQKCWLTWEKIYLKRRTLWFLINLSGATASKSSTNCWVGSAMPWKKSCLSSRIDNPKRLKNSSHFLWGHGSSCYRSTSCEPSRRLTNRMIVSRIMTKKRQRALRSYSSNCLSSGKILEILAFHPKQEKRIANRMRTTGNCWLLPLTKLIL